MEKPVLVLCIDRDNDLYEKAKLSGPIIGRDSNLAAATKLALADPEDPDSNTIFSAIKQYDELKADNKNVEIVTLTGHKKLGYIADAEISRQLEKILDQTHATNCIFISDGASDEEILPIIKSRLKIDATKVVFIKQAKELEKTYFVILEKLKDPYYAKLIFGIPAILLLLFSLASYFNIGWQPVGIIIGTYLILKGFGIDEILSEILNEFRISLDKVSWVTYVAGFTLLLLAVFISYQSYFEALRLGLSSSEKIFAYVVKGLVVLMPLALIFILVGKITDAIIDKKKFMITKYALYMVGVVLVALILRIATDWLLNLYQPYVSFGDFLLTIIVCIITGYLSIMVIKQIRTDLLGRMKLEGKEVLNENGAYMGKVVGVNGAEGLIVIQTILEKKYGINFDSIVAITDKIIVKSSIS